MARLLAIDTSSSWCSVALSAGTAKPLFRHEKLSATASQNLLPWIEALLQEAEIDPQDLDAIAVGVGPGAFTGVRLGVAVTQGLALSANLPVIPVISLDAIAAQFSHKDQANSSAKNLVVAIDARMDEVYWAQYQLQLNAFPKRISEVKLSSPETVDFSEADVVIGSAIVEFGNRLAIPKTTIQNAQIGIHSLGILMLAQSMWDQDLQISVDRLEPLYIRNKVAFTTEERLQNTLVK
ncbi:tRNA (adenosine(37)-N6)-threonylcarbamoyltransferase complex dimerization subunit type 1 TsaB [Polynucleobacter paneuropaeus]|nr:tRNA (adenosine(37)-N6)-threonylcarbamoyltransferase complex dimerization subunit type 1 TsaB [Polynucleobacter paneuropaeus]